MEEPWHVGPPELRYILQAGLRMRRCEQVGLQAVLAASFLRIKLPRFQVFKPAVWF